MKQPYDIAKNQENIAKHGVSFDDVAGFEWDNSITRADDRRNYGEDRFISYGMLNNRLHVLVWTQRNGNVRPISFRKANAREREFYAKKTQG